jgi:peroxiredoxin Q/BCP
LGSITQPGGDVQAWGAVAAGAAAEPPDRRLASNRGKVVFGKDAISMTKVLAFLAAGAAVGLAAVAVGLPLLGSNELKAGDPAPPFSLPGTDGQTHTLADMKGRVVVLAWFPKAFTSGCTLECKSFAEYGDAIKRFKDVSYFMISVDPLDVNKRFADTHGGGKFPILSDASRQVAEAYGVLSPVGVAHRWTFYIGPDGRILEVDRSVTPATSAQDVVTRLKALGLPTAGE